MLPLRLVRSAAGWVEVGKATGVEGTLPGPGRPSLGSGGCGPHGCAVVPLQYKSTPGKKVSVVGWMVQLPDDPEHPDIFQLNNPDKGRQQASAGSLQLLSALFLLLLNVRFETVGPSEAAALLVL